MWLHCTAKWKQKENSFELFWGGFCSDYPNCYCLKSSQ